MDFSFIFEGHASITSGLLSNFQKNITHQTLHLLVQREDILFQKYKYKINIF